MKKRIVSFVLAVVMLALAAGVVYALFSHMAKSAVNRLEAAKVEVQVIGDPIDLGGITPGSMDTVMFELHNTGTLAVDYTIEYETSGALFEGENPVQLGSLQSGHMEVGEMHYIVVTWALPIGAGNEYNGATGTFQLVVHAQQAVGGYPVH